MQKHNFDKGNRPHRSDNHSKSPPLWWSRSRTRTKKLLLNRNQGDQRHSQQKQGRSWHSISTPANWKQTKMEKDSCNQQKESSFTSTQSAESTSGGCQGLLTTQEAEFDLRSDGSETPVCERPYPLDSRWLGDVNALRWDDYQHIGSFGKSYYHSGPDRRRMLPHQVQQTMQEVVARWWWGCMTFFFALVMQVESGIDRSRPRCRQGMCSAISRLLTHGRGIFSHSSKTMPECILHAR